MLFLALIIAASAYAPDTPQPLLGNPEVGVLSVPQPLLGDLEAGTLITPQTIDDPGVGALSVETDLNNTSESCCSCNNTIQNCKDRLVTLMLMLVSSYSLTALADGAYSAGTLLQTRDLNIKPELQQMIIKIHESPNETLQELLWLELPYQLTIIKLTPYFVYECYKITACLLYACQTCCNCTADKQDTHVKKTRAILCKASALIGGLLVNIQRIQLIIPMHFKVQ